MIPPFPNIEGLAERTAKWFSENRTYQKIFGESLLVFALGSGIVEICDLEAETDFYDVSARGVPGYFAYDLVVKDGGKVRAIFEMKYLKAREGSKQANVAYSRVTDDILKLAAPDSLEICRYFVVARPFGTLLPSKVAALFASKRASFDSSGSFNTEVIKASNRLVSSVTQLNGVLKMPSGCDICLRGSSMGASDPIEVSIYQISRIERS